jgi:exoribonuclease R
VKPGDVLQLKEGTLGLSEASDLYAIYLDRVKRGSNYLVVAHTVEGEKEISRDKVKEVALKARVDDPSSMSSNQLDDRLRQLVNDIESGGEADTSIERRHSIDELDDRRLWELIVNDLDGSFTPEDAARMIFEGPESDDVAQVRDALQSCQQEGVGYFERAEGRGERYQAYTVEEIKSARRAIEGIRKLRNELIQVEEVEDPETGEPETLIHSLHPDEAELEAADRERLATVADQMVDFVLHDRDRGQVGLADTPIHTLDGFILNRFCRFLAYDWLGTQDTSISGAYVRFLLGTDLLDTHEANELVARRHVNLSEHFAWEYPQRPERQANRRELELDDDERARRTDLTHLETYTIDPTDAEDFDDAVSLVEDGDEDLLYVHIADVSHYVERGSALDFEARGRGTSAYLPTRVLPMLPPKLSEDLCSLREGEPRCAMTAKMRIDAEGRVVDSEVMEAIVEVDANHAYEHADRAIEAGEDPFACLHELAQRMSDQRMGLELETDELKVEIGRGGVDPDIKTGTQATKLIERFMVAANEAVARKLADNDVPAPYRCHPLPERSGVDRFNRQMRVMEQPIEIELPELEDDEEDEAEGDQDADELMDALEGGGSVELVDGGFVSDEEDDEEDEEGEDASASPSAGMTGLASLDEEGREAWLAPFQQALGSIEDLGDDRVRKLVHLKMLGCLGRAFYTPDNIGHFGLGSQRYLHFTSPIRRYPDLLTHRQIKWLIRSEEERADPEEPPHSDEELIDLCPRASDQGEEAEQLERDLIAVAMAFDTLVDEETRSGTGLVNGLTKGGVFLTLERGREARLPTSDIPGGPWDVDDAGAKLYKGEIESPEELTEEAQEGDWREMEDPDTGELVHVRLRLGDRVPVEVSSIDLATGQVAVKLAGGGDDEDV